MSKQAASLYFHGVLFIFCILIVQSQTVNPDRTEKLENLMTGVLQNCVLETVDRNIAPKVDKMALDGAKTIYIDFNLYNFSERLIKQDQGSVYNPVSWVLTTGRYGQSLLLLRPQYEIFSLRSLSLGTERIEVSVKQTPMNCLTNYNATVVSDALGEFLLHKFNSPSRNTTVSVETLKETEHICNLHIVPNNAYLLPYGRNCLTERIAERLKQLWRYIHRVFQIDILSSQESIERPEKLSVKNKILQLIVIFSCLLTILSAVLLAMECIVFLAEVFMYTLIGIVINSSFTLKYLSLAFLLGFYARDSFNTVTEEYLTFNKFLNGYLVDKMRDEVEKISMQSHEDQRNTAFQVSLDDTEGQDDKPVSLTNRNEKLKWLINGLILFLDKNDTPYITSKFFFDTCYMEQAGVPGPLVVSLLRATQRFMLICVFLFFVVIVILAFGNEYGISATNQMFATIAGGFLPYILRWVLFKQPEPVAVDPNNLSFKSKFRRKIKEYKEHWEVSDIIIDTFKTIETVDDNDVKCTAAETGDEKKSQNEVIVLEENNSKDDTIMLEEIPATVKDNTMRTVDLLIYDNLIV
ncbi:unnamed protein product [Mytilus coruscus]|uniref:Uncharacterized protein n=1 Tax=Mytilus coruscus TaxID=42192 RepID=A0A6J8E4T6_MYTCO|nr:unnamed protein product [Mytilus coruscus]